MVSPSKSGSVAIYIISDLDTKSLILLIIFGFVFIYSRSHVFVSNPILSFGKLYTCPEECVTINVGSFKYFLIVFVFV